MPAMPGEDFFALQRRLGGNSFFLPESFDHCGKNRGKDKPAKPVPQISSLSQLQLTQLGDMLRGKATQMGAYCLYEGEELFELQHIATGESFIVGADCSCGKAACEHRTVVKEYLDAAPS
jgi:hypothetical protein